MDVLTNLMQGFEVAFAPEVLFFCFVGVTIGTLVGVLPGIGAIAAIAMCLPLTFHLDPTAALVMLAGIFYGSQYGGSTAAILLNIPGTAQSAVTCIDGYPLAQKGRAGPALFITSVSSFVGGSLAIVLLMFFAPVLASIALKFHSADYFSVMLLTLVAASTMSGGSVIKGLAMVAAGVMLGLVGTDVTTGTYRFTFGRFELTDGLEIVALATGLFGVAEVLVSLSRKLPERSNVRKVTFREMIPSKTETRESVFSTLRGTAVGSWIGILPAAGPTLATFMAYALERRVAKDPTRFGKGAVEGIASPEAANNAAVQSAFIPTLSLGLPGDAVMAILLGAMMLHGITPGPQFISQNPDMFWGLVASFWVGNLILLVLNIPFIGLWVKLVSIPYKILYPCILFFICIGVYSVNNSVFDVIITVSFGWVGFFMIKYRYPVAPLLLGFVLGPMIEENFRRSMLITGGSPAVFFERPLSASFLTMGVLFLVLPALWGMWKRRRVAHVEVPTP